MDGTIMCRSCLTTTSAEYIDLQTPLSDELTLFDCFSICTRLEANDADSLPNTICSICRHDLQIAYEFIQSSRQADVILRQNVITRYEIDPTDPAQSSVQDFKEAGSPNFEDKEIQLEDIIMETEPTEDYDAVIPTSGYFHPYDVEVDTKENLHDVSKEVSQDASTFKEEFEIFVVDNSQTLNGAHDVQEDPEDKSMENNDVTKEELIDPATGKWMCSICNKMQPARVEYETHLNWHKGEKPYKCDLCFLKFRSRISLARHARTGHYEIAQQKKFSCEWCNENFEIKSLLIYHQRHEHKEKVPLQCTLCRKVFYSEEILNQHIVIMHSTMNVPTECPYCKKSFKSLRMHVHEDHQDIIKKIPQIFGEDNEFFDDYSENLSKPHQCELCPRSFLTKQNLKDHLYWHRGERPYNCPHCNYKFRTKSAKSSHIRAYHEEEEEKVREISIVKCEICEKTLRENNLSKHMEMHQRKVQPQRFLCSFCPKELKSKYQLIAHEKFTHKLSEEDAGYKCDQCDDKFFLAKHLRQHKEKAHAEEKPHVCGQCGMNFKKQVQLMVHMKMHSEKQLKCPHCDKVYTRNIDLKGHMQTHADDLPFACHLCDKRYAVKVRLTYHLQKHLGIKHKCKECEAIYNSRSKLKTHMFKHTGMPYVCEDCPDASFPARKHFRRHLKRAHRKQISDEDLVKMFEKNVGKAFRVKATSELNNEYHMMHEFNETETEIITEQTICEGDVEMDNEVQIAVEGILKTEKKDHQQLQQQESEQQQEEELTVV